MSKYYDLPLKVLWIFNSNEAEMAIDFYLKEGGKSYQVKGADTSAFDNSGKLLICLTDNMNAVYQAYPNRSVLITEGDKLQKIWNYWKSESGEIRYNSLFKQWENQNAQMQKSFFERDEKEPIPDNKSMSGVSLNKKQVYSLVFEIETIVDMKKAFKGEVSGKEIMDLISASSNGFSKVTKEAIVEEAKRKGLFK